MSRILLVDDSPHAQRMGERILAAEGYEVITVSNAESALIRLDDADPDLVLADTVMPGRTGYEICQYLKMSPRHRHVRVVLTAGVLETFDEEQARQAGADASLRKPFEASALLGAVKPLVDAAVKDRAERVPGSAPFAAGRPAGPVTPAADAPFVAVVDAERVHAAVTVALDAALESMVDEITRRVLKSLRSGRREQSPEPVTATVEPEPARPEPPLPPAVPIEPVRRVTPLRIRSGFILGLDFLPPDDETPAPKAD